MAYNPAVWYGLVARLTPLDHERLREVEAGHYLAPDADPHLPYLRDVYAKTLWAKVDSTTWRFSAKFHDPTGPQSVASGEEPCGSFHQQNNGGRRLWQSVAGEFHAR
jgi:hypothetical protein